MKNKIIVALDFDSREEALDIVDKLGDKVGAYKVGMQLFNATGASIIKDIEDKGGKVFLDLKFHDIPNTVEKASRVVAGYGAFMFNVHACGGYEMMKSAAWGVREEAAKLSVVKPLLIGVTVLTSMSQKEMNNDMRVPGSVADQVRALALLARKAGLDGVVASPHEIGIIRDVCGPDFLIVTPGIRPTFASKNDQKRVMTPYEAVSKGCDYMVIGRPITKADDPVLAVQMIVDEMEGISNDNQ